MDYNRSPRSHNRKLAKIALPYEIKTFFAKRGKFVKGLPSYEQIEGRNPKSIENHFDNRWGFPLPLIEKCPVNNETPESYESAQEKTKELLHLFFHSTVKGVEEPLREYMLTGGTKPIRVSSEINGKERRIYVKLPSVERITGLSLYNLISGNNPIDFLFSEYVFVEDSVPGRHMDDEHISYFKSLKNLPESVIRLAVQDKFLGINDLDRILNLPSRSNILVNLLIQPDGSTIAFDVDCAFTKKITEYNLVDIIRDKGIKISKDLEKSVKVDEAKRIVHTIDATSYKAFNKFISLMDNIPHLKKQLKEIGFNNSRDYFLEREEWLKSLSRS